MGPIQATETSSKQYNYDDESDADDKYGMANEMDV